MGSPCFNAGDPAGVFTPALVDIDGEPRMQGGVIDMGADEFAVDCNGNTIADHLDIAAGTSTDCDQNGVADDCESLPDCNGNHIPDACDLAAGTSTDCDRNGVVDQCEALQDCNGNHMPDACDLAAGTSTDCNGNGILDECEGLSDCNGNGQFDACDLAAGLDQDCNGNGILDSCDLAAGTSVDLDRNGVPDECHKLLLVPAAFATIQAAIDAAVDDDTVVVADGIYGGVGNEQLDLKGKAITVRSQNGPTHCVIDCGGSGRAFRLDTPAASGVRPRCSPTGRACRCRSPAPEIGAGASP